MPDGGRALAGVDGCRAGWIAAVEGVGSETRLVVAAGFGELLGRLAPRTLIAVDMPIGLPEGIRGAGRAAEIAVRPLLGGRRASLFSMPAREAAEAGFGPFESRAAREAAYGRSCALARETSQPPRALSRQGFAILPRVGEIDRLLRADAALRERVFEGHPELVFAGLGGGAAGPKRAPGGAGLAARRALLLAAGVSPALLEAARPRGAAEDDRLDACAMLVLARRLAAGAARPHPDPPGRDRHGLAIAIWN